MASLTEIKSRMIAELEELETLTAAAPETHPARRSLAAIREHFETSTESDLADWLRYHADYPVRDIANMVGRALVAGRDASTVLRPFGGHFDR